MLEPRVASGATLDQARRRFIKYAISSAAGASIAALGFPYVQSLFPSGGNQVVSTRSTSATSTGTYSPPPVTPDYAEFLTWLHSASRPYAGTSLNIAFEDEPTPLGTLLQDRDFADATSMNNQYSTKSYFLHLSDISLMVNTKSSTYDVFDVDHQDVASFKDHILSPTVMAEMYPDLTFQAITQDDFEPLAWSLVAKYPPGTFASGGAQNTLFIPFDMDLMLQYYRSDIYASNGVSPATDWSTYIQNLKATAHSPITFGTACQASPGISVVYEYLNHLASFGGQLWTYDGTKLSSGLGSQAALSALQNYISVSKYADYASASYSWDDVNRDLFLGIVGSAIQLDGLAFNMEDSARSHVVGEMGYAPNPAGPAGSFSTFAGSGIGISKYSKNPQASWLWLQWAVSKGRQEAAILNRYRAYPSRKSVLTSPDVAPMLTSQKYAPLKAASTIWGNGSIATLTPFPKWPGALNTISYYLYSAFSGQDPQTALNSAVQKIQQSGALTF
jgi:multiple sugar transport system substrate-binding protein